MKRFYRVMGLVFSLILVGHAPTVWAQDVDLSFLTTRAEASQYEQTTAYDELMGFLNVAVSTSERLFLTQFGYSVEGRALPLVVYGDVADATPEAVMASGKTRVYLQGNIHAGEVCGKEALLMLVRALAAGQHPAWADSLVLLIAPIYNADGNERVSLYNRPRQHGPVGGMGQRPNAQDKDLNRDHMKLDTPEARSLVGMMNRYDPHVLVDLHTTNGSRHAYHLTYAPPLHPNTPQAIDALLRDRWLPAVTEAVKATYGWDYYYYGNLPWRGSNADRGWYTFDHRPRFNNNYVGLRNRVAILSEAYAYATFEDRILATLYFVEEILHYAHEHASEVEAITQAADETSVVGQALAVRAMHAPSPDPVSILMGAVTEEQNPFTGAPILRRTDLRQPEMMLEYGHFEATDTAIAPAAYLVPSHLSVVLDRLRAHGIQYYSQAADATRLIEQFAIDSTRTAERPFQGHHEQILFGRYAQVTMTLPEGTVVVPMDQPLGRLAFSLLEPRSDDGLAAWGMLSKEIEGAAAYPILRVPAN